MSAEQSIPDAAGQLERTTLSWNRTLLAFAANGVLLIKVGYASGDWTVVAGSAVLVLTLIAWLITSRTYRRLRNRPQTATFRLRKRLHAAAWSGIAVGLADIGAILTYG